MVAFAATLTISCSQKDTDVVSNSSVTSKALPGPVVAIEHFTGDDCRLPVGNCLPEIVITADLRSMFRELGETPRPGRLPDALTEHIYVGHLDNVILGRLYLSLVYNSRTNKLFVVFKSKNVITGVEKTVAVYPFSTTHD